MNLLLIEDDPKIASALVNGLTNEGFAVEHFLTGEDGLSAVLDAPQRFALAIVDVMLTGIDGISVIKALRDAHITIPVLILSAKRSVDERIHGLRHGGDDYLTKPFSFEELIVRVQSILRRSTVTAGEVAVSTYEDLTLDRMVREACRSGKVIELQPREFRLLDILISKPGQTFSKQILLEKIWHYRFDPQTNVVDVLVCRLRSKVDGPFENKLIHTKRGVGYFLGAANRA